MSEHRHLAPPYCLTKVHLRLSGPFAYGFLQIPHWLIFSSVRPGTRVPLSEVFCSPRFMPYKNYILFQPQPNTGHNLYSLETFLFISVLVNMSFFGHPCLQLHIPLFQGLWLDLHQLDGDHAGHTSGQRRPKPPSAHRTVLTGHVHGSSH